MPNGYEFNYNLSSSLGPQHWGDVFPEANGRNQSPINIDTHKQKFHQQLLDHPIMFDYDECKKISNTGHSFQITIDENLDSIATGGPTRDTYKFLQMHMHWGKVNDRGSEHSIDGMFHSAEIHFVNWNCTKYRNVQEAMKSIHPDGLLVFAIFVKIGNENSEISIIERHFQQIHAKGNVDKLGEHIEWKKLFPENLRDFWTYHGSLTTPPCTECVRWVIFRDPIEISEEQLNQLRSLSVSDKKHKCMACNDRPTCDLHHRIVFSSFK